MGGRPGDRRPARAGPSRASAASAARPRSASSRARSSETSSRCRHGESCARHSASARQRLPIPATSRWSRSASPIASRWSAPRILRERSRRCRADRRGCPARGCGRGPSSSSSTGPCQSTASAFSPRRTSHGVPWRVLAPFRSKTCQRPFMRRWLRSTSPSSKRRSRFLPTASTLEQPPTVEALRDACHPGARVRRLDRELLADEHLEAAGRAVE